MRVQARDTEPAGNPAHTRPLNAPAVGRDADWLARVETGFVVPGPDEVSRILVEYGIREAHAANVIIDMARRASSTPPWLGATRRAIAELFSRVNAAGVAEAR